MVSSAYVHPTMTSPLRTHLLVLLFFILLSHAIGILLPETGFDALWYHLPIVRDMAQSREIRFVPGVAQSDQPRLGEIFFTPGYIIAQEMGVKVTAYVATLILLMLVYRLARLYGDDTDALVATILVATFHTIAWAASSGYVDTIRAIFEVAFLYVVLRPKRLRYDAVLILGLLAGALLTKLVTLLFLPSLLVLLFLKRGVKITLLAGSMAIGLYIVGRFPISFFWSTGHALIGLHEIFMSVRSFLLLPWELSFHAESYTTPLFLFIMPFVYMERHFLLKTQWRVVVYLFLSYLTWVFVVPISVRYDLSAIILTTIICIAIMKRVARRYTWVRILYGFILVITIFSNMSVRLGAAVRSLPYLIGSESQADYLKAFDVGILKGPLEAWYTIK